MPRIVVIGGGATGCGVARDLVLRGYQTTLIETCISNTGCYIITGSDSWGDGWNGGNITVTINNGESQIYELPDGSYGYWTFELNMNIEFKMIYLT